MSEGKGVQTVYWR